MNSEFQSEKKRVFWLDVQAKYFLGCTPSYLAMNDEIKKLEK
ncbi:MAG TPA: hypothetical protein VGP47_07705 [Parachlamydiaceae bacterium]|nr:hypothetical protein [Parachlamydiaceae bacterium]